MRRPAGRSWAFRGLLSMADQAFIAGANFLLLVLFARWLTAGDYGAVSIGLSVFLLAANFHNALLLEPMSVLGPRRFREKLGGYFRAALMAHALLAGLLAAFVLSASAVLWSAAPPLAGALAGLSLSTPAMLSFWVLRRMCYVTGDPASALAGSSAVLTASLAGAALVWARHWQSPAAIFLISACAALAGAAVLAWRLRGRIAARSAGDPLLREVAGSHWSYARWMMGVCVTYWLANSALPALLGLTAGFAGAGELRVVENLAAPVLQTTTAFSLLLLPWVSEQVEARGAAFLAGFQRKAMALGLVSMGGYLGVVLLFRQELLSLFPLTRGHELAAGLVPLVALATLIRGVSDLSVSTALKAAARPDAHFWASLVSAILVLTAGYMLTSSRGVTGAAITMLLSNLAQALVLAAFFAELTLRGRTKSYAAVD